jgi:L-lactate dehydrogenase complex protein LldE
MRVALFVPCYVDQLWPEVGLAAAEVLEAQGVEVDYPEAQTCCGQPFLTDGYPTEARRLAERFADVFASSDHVVCPSGSCAAMVRHHYEPLLGRELPIARRVHELCSFLVDVLGVSAVPGAFARRVGLHPSCHGLRELGLARPSEHPGPGTGADKVALLLRSLAGIELVTPERADECCGFGGTFAVGEADVSCRMGGDRLRAHEAAGAEVLTSIDASCLLHLRGLAERRGSPLRVMHVAEILAGREPRG